MKIRTSSKTTRSGSSACGRLLSHRLLLHGAEIGQVPSQVFHFFSSCHRDRACSISSGQMPSDQMPHFSKVCKWEAGEHPGSLSASCWTWRVYPCFWLPSLQRRIPGVNFGFNFDCHQFMCRAAYLKMETVALWPWQSWTQSWEVRPGALLCSSLPSSSGLPRTL